MKLTVLNWLKDSSVPFIGKVIELIFRIILLILPLGVFLLLIQLRSKASKVSNISVYTNDNSVWQHIFPGFMLVSIDQTSLHKKITSTRNSVQAWLKANECIIEVLFLSAIVILMLIIGGNR